MSTAFFMFCSHFKVLEQEGDLEAPQPQEPIFEKNHFFHLRLDLAHSWGSLDDWLSQNLILSTLRYIGFFGTSSKGIMTKGITTKGIMS